jgi:polysaccharide export outer membrane protein
VIALKGPVCCESEKFLRPAELELSIGTPEGEVKMKRKTTVCLFLLLCLAIAAIVRAQTTLTPTKATPLYIIQPNDVLDIYVYKEEKLSTKVTVRPDGRISFPLIQDMQAEGLNPGQLKERIEAALKEYIDAPNVTVIVDAIQSYRVYVTGKVGKPGMIMTEKPINVLQALSIAGGFLEFARQAETVIIRNSGEESALYKFNYPEVIKGNNFSQNMPLKSGDVVVVP